jgi:hypothetical protein
MIYRFKSQATGELIMLKEAAHQILGILDKDPAAPGIITAEQIPAAVAQLREAIVAEEASQARQIQEAKTKGEPVPRFSPLGLRQRCYTFIEMLERSAQEDEPVRWGD